MRKIYLFCTLLLTFAVSSCGLLPTTTGSNANAESPANAEPAGTPVAASAESQNAAIEQLVTDLYKAHDGKKSPFFQTKDRGLVDKFFTKQLADLIWKDAQNSQDEIAPIDFDVLYDAQDVEKKGFAVGTAAVTGNSATVTATFTNYGEKKRITFNLKSVGDIWKIDDIKYQNGSTLAGILRDYHGGGDTKTNAPPVTNVAGEFEGTYSVGDTTCTVKPVKMAFEVRWAKGKGSEIFVYRGSGNAFDSDDGNSFEFSDERYNTGTFYRADGKTFSVTRSR